MKIKLPRYGSTWNIARRERKRKREKERESDRERERGILIANEIVTQDCMQRAVRSRILRYYLSFFLSFIRIFIFFRLFASLFYFLCTFYENLSACVPVGAHIIIARQSWTYNYVQERRKNDRKIKQIPLATEGDNESDKTRNLLRRQGEKQRRGSFQETAVCTRCAAMFAISRENKYPGHSSSDEQARLIPQLRASFRYRRFLCPISFIT